MNIKVSRTSTLWFLLPIICLDTDQIDGSIGLAIAFLNWEIGFSFNKGKRR